MSKTILLLLSLLTLSIHALNFTNYVFLSYSGYCSPETVLNFSCYWCDQYQGVLTVNSVVYDKQSDTYGYIGHSGDTAYVMFRGTVREHITNWITDLTFTLSDFHPEVSGAKVHTGFLNAYKGVHAQLLSSMNEIVAKYAVSKVVVAGHSLGGSLATICAADFARRGIVKEIELYTFGAPRTGNYKFAMYVNSALKSSYRVVNQRDIVPHVPQTIWGYSHVPTEYWYSNGTEYYTVCNGSGEDKYCSAGLYIATSIKDHLTYLGYDERDGHPYGCHGENPEFFAIPPGSIYSK
eukprot:TRINITY_DN1779_c0_g1_i3.p1 TRINITY_DN1779_c0_g1~~TRINITY_DN1779_c0_g1_i3.p1  ORF type:complete len:293 (+),score=36.72 TRINITY_DN1779_c0_g1_i3:229-1107(+)